MRHRGFTLVELMIVMVIIGILITFILRASMGGIRRAEEKATIALVAKLEQAMTDRMDALTTYRADPTNFHYQMASLWNDRSIDPVDGTSILPIRSVQRAQVIAQYDYVRAQMPDVFVRQPTNTNYPFNFGATTFGGTTDDFAQIPLGAASPGTGVYGAAYEIAAGIYKQLGYGPKGIDGNDNDNDGLVDELDEATLGMSGDEATAATALIATRLTKHTHKTARSEMLYAILVEGGGVYGSAFDKDDFTSKEVQDTDGDGLMEFVDAWGEPLQFYRWPILYRSDSQKGFPDLAKLTQDASVGLSPPGPYNVTKTGAVFASYETREQNPMDPNQTLLAPAWWGSTFNNSVPTVIGTANGKISGAAMMFMSMFIPLVDPIAAGNATASAAAWDRSSTTTTGYYMRRAFYSRFLILSAGPDKTPGTAMLGINYVALDDRSSIEIPGVSVGPGALTGNARDSSGAAVGLTVAGMLLESQGGKVDLNRNSILGDLTTFGAGGRNDTNSQLEYYSQDDISSQNLQSTGGALQ